ncbi:MAG: family 10 glycosylhydrolase [Candidatus Sumerlaeota bacterium]
MTNEPTETPTAMEAAAAQADIPIPQTRIALLEAERLFDRDSLERAINRLADSGWNTIILPAFLEGYPIFPSQVWADYGMKRQHPGLRKWNPLELAFEIAWQRGLDILIAVQPYLVGRSHDSRKGPPLVRHYPEWLARRHPKRKRRLSEASAAKTFYCPVNPEYRRFLCDTLHIVLEDYPFHGLLIDLRHYPFYATSEGKYLPWCYCEACREKTLRDLGFDPVGVDIHREAFMIEKWKEWQAAQIDDAIAYMRQRVLKARRTMRVLGLLSTDSGLEDESLRPLIHWRTWVERALVESLVLDKYAPDPQAFTNQVREDLETMPKESLLIPTIPRAATDTSSFMQTIREEPVPGLLSRFPDWDLPTFAPKRRIQFRQAAFPSESDPISSICVLFEHMCREAPQEEEFCAFLADLSAILSREHESLTLNRLMIVADNIQGLHKKVAEGRLDFGRFQDQVLHDLDLAHRLAFLAACDLRD